MQRDCIDVQGLLIIEQLIVHFPKLTLIACTSGRFSSLEGLWMHRVEREIAEYIFNFSGGNIISDDLWQRLTDVLCAEWSLIVREFDNRQLRILVALERQVFNIQNNFLRLP